MRNGQNNKRMRGRGGSGGGGSGGGNNNNNNNRKNQNPLTRVYELNGPDIKIRGTPSHVAEKYLQLARDAQSSGDPVAAENYYQHAEHYFRLIAAAQEQFRQTQPQFYRPDQESSRNDSRTDDNFDDSEDDGMDTQPGMGGDGYGAREQQQQQQQQQQPYLPRDAQPFPREQQQPYPPRQQPQPGPVEGSGDVNALPSFITGGQPQPAIPAQNGANGHEAGQPDRFPLHRRRRRHRGPRTDAPGGAPDQRPEGD